MGKSKFCNSFKSNENRSHDSMARRVAHFTEKLNFISIEFRLETDFLGTCGNNNLRLDSRIFYKFIQGTSVDFLPSLRPLERPTKIDFASIPLNDQFAVT